MDEKLKKCIEVLVHYVYDTYDGNESEIYTLSYYYMYINKVNDIEGLLACFVQAIIDVTDKEFSDVYKKTVNHPQVKKLLF